MNRRLLIPTSFLMMPFYVMIGCGDGGKPRDGGVHDAGADGGAGDASVDAGLDAGGDASLFAEGCPEAGKSLAKKIENERLRALGPDALGVNGDYLLMNENAAFIIQGPEHTTNTYYYYPGILIDAVAINDCKQASLERFQELWLLMGRLNASDFLMSILRTFRGDSVEIVNDGSDGRAAKVRVKGADDIFWLLEQNLIGAAYNSGKARPVSQPMGIEIWIDYVLQPGSQILQVDMTFINKTSAPQTLMCGTAIQFGITTTPRYYAQSVLSIGGYNIDQGLPWNVAAARNGDGAWAFAMKGAFMGTLTIAGVTAYVDVNQMASAIQLAAAGQSGDRQKVTYFVSVGGTDSNSATKNLQAVNPEPIPAMPYKLSPFSGTVTDSVSAAPIKGALVELQAQDSKNNWRTMDSFYSGEDGAFGGEIPNFTGLTMQYRLVASFEGRTTVISDVFNFPGMSEKSLVMEPPGTIHLNITDQNANPIPAKVTLWKGSLIAARLFARTGLDTFPVIPGDYEVSVTRGFEYTSFQGSISVKAGQTSNLAAVLNHAVDTAGFMSMDGHIHSGYSADNTIPLPERIATCAGEGLEVAVSTDHEFIVDWQAGIDETGLGKWVATIPGEEASAPLPEHTNPMGMGPDYTIDARGGEVRWWGMDIAEIYAAERARGAKIIQLNHPRNGCNYMCKIKYDRITGQPQLDDPTKLGFKPGAALWSWNFDVVEYQNGPQWVFLNSGDPDATGTFDDWMSFINLGHRITAAGNSDSHDYEIVGTPRNYFVSSTEEPLKLVPDDLYGSLLNGRVLVSNGAFARVKINGTAGMGDTITDKTGEVSLGVRIEAPPEIDVAYFKVYVNCDQVLNVATTAPDAVVKHDGTVKVPISKDSNVAVLGFGKKSMPRGFSQYNPAQVPRFTANPIYVDFDGNGRFDPPGGKTCAYDLKAP
jgi:hypothetical protein